MIDNPDYKGEWKAPSRPLCGNQNFTARSSRRPPRHRRDACSMAWRCGSLTARFSQHERFIALE